jgi:hypothetical protein
MGPQRAGDVNGDNVIGIADFTVLRGSFGRSVGDPGYDGRADYSGNEAIDLPDFNAVRANFGMSGAPPN